VSGDLERKLERLAGDPYSRTAGQQIVADALKRIRALEAENARSRAPDNWPSHTAELTRKLSETLADLAWKVEQGEVKPAEAFVAVGALWDTTAGLIERETLDLLNQLRLELKQQINQN
jgi:hypothetical protein